MFVISSKTCNLLLHNLIRAKNKYICLARNVVRFIGNVSVVKTWRVLQTFSGIDGRKGTRYNAQRAFIYAGITIEEFQEEFTIYLAHLGRSSRTRTSTSSLSRLGNFHEASTISCGLLEGPIALMVDHLYVLLKGCWTWWTRQSRQIVYPPWKMPRYLYKDDDHLNVLLECRWTW